MTTDWYEGSWEDQLIRARIYYAPLGYPAATVYLQFCRQPAPGPSSDARVAATWLHGTRGKITACGWTRLYGREEFILFRVILSSHRVRPTDITLEIGYSLPLTQAVILSPR